MGGPPPPLAALDSLGDGADNRYPEYGALSPFGKQSESSDGKSQGHPGIDLDEEDHCTRLFYEFDCDGMELVTFLELKEIMVYMGALLPVSELRGILLELKQDPEGAFSLEDVLLIYKFYKETSKLRSMHKSDATRIHIQRASQSYHLHLGQVALRWWKVLSLVCTVGILVDLSYQHTLKDGGMKEATVSRIALLSVVTFLSALDIVVWLHTMTGEEAKEWKRAFTLSTARVPGTPQQDVFSPGTSFRSFSRGMASDPLVASVADHSFMEEENDGIIPQASEFSVFDKQGPFGDGDRLASFIGDDVQDECETVCTGLESQSSMRIPETPLATLTARKGVSILSPLRSARQLKLHRQTAVQVNRSAPVTQLTRQHRIMQYLRLKYRGLKQLVVNPYYIRSLPFVLDVLSSLPLDVILYCMSDSSSSFAWAAFATSHLRLLRVHRFFDILRQGQCSLMTRDDILWLYRTCPLVIGLCTFILLVHGLACVWVIISEDREDYANYLHAAYFVMYTLQAVGYGDVPVISFSQRVFAMSICAMGVVVNGVLVGILTLLVQRTSSKANKQDLLLSAIMRLENISFPAAPRDEVLSFLNNSNLATDSLSQRLPSTLRHTIRLFLRVAFLEKVCFFEGIPRDCRISICGLLTDVVALPEEILQVRGDHVTSMVFVLQGFVHSWIPSKSDEDRDSGRVLCRQDDFGEEVFLRKPVAKRSVQSLTYTELLSLSLSAGQYLCKVYPTFEDILMKRLVGRGYSPHHIVFGPDSPVGKLVLPVAMRKKNQPKRDSVQITAPQISVNRRPPPTVVGSKVGGMLRNGMRSASLQRVSSFFGQRVSEACHNNVADLSRKSSGSEASDVMSSAFWDLASLMSKRQSVVSRNDGSTPPVLTPRGLRATSFGRELTLVITEPKVPPEKRAEQQRRGNQRKSRERLPPRIAQVVRKGVVRHLHSSLESVVSELSPLLRGAGNYSGLLDTPMSVSVSSRSSSEPHGHHQSFSSFRKNVILRGTSSTQPLLTVDYGLPLE